MEKKIEVLLSTMHSNVGLDDIPKMNISNFVIVDQCDSEEIKIFKNGKIIKTTERGLSNSRNKLLENATGDILILADDDTRFVKDYEKIISDAYFSNKDADIIAFQYLNKDGKQAKNYKNNKKYLNRFSIKSVSSIEISFKKKVISDGVKFNNLFGIGAKYNHGEENLFLADCIKKGFKILYIPTAIVVHLDDNSMWKNDHMKTIISKGALFNKLFGSINSIFLIPLFALKKRNFYRLNIIKMITLMYRGYFLSFKD